MIFERYLVAFPGCGVLLIFNEVELTGADGGDWLTRTVSIDTNKTSRDDRNFLWVCMYSCGLFRGHLSILCLIYYHFKCIAYT